MDTAEIDRLVKRAVAGRAIAKESDRHLVGAAGFRADRQPDRRGNSSGDDAVGPKEPFRRRVQVHAAATTAATAGGFAGQLGQHHLGRYAFGQGVTVSAVRAGDPVLASQMGHDAHGGRFFADI